MNVHHIATIRQTMAPIWSQVRLLFAEHQFVTVVCGFFVVMMVLGFYRFLRSISPALVGLVLLLVLFIIVIDWTQTGNEPAFMKPFIDWLTPWLPAPVYPNK